MAQLALVAFAAFLGGAVQSASGFGSAAVMMVFMPLVFDMLHAPAICSAISCLLAISLSLQFRKHISIRRLAVPAVSCVIASTLAIQIAKDLDLDLISILFGIFLILLAIYSFALKGKLNFKDNFACALGCGLLAGVFSGLFAVGGPVMAAFYLSVCDDNQEYIANMQAYFALTNLINIYTRFTNGLYDASSLLPILIGVAGVLVGKQVGIRILKKMDAKMLTRAVYSVIGLSGVLTIIGHI